MTLITLRKWISSPKLSIQAKIFIAFGLLSLFSIVSVTGIVYVNMRETIKANAITSVSDSIRQADESLNVMLKEIDRLNTVAATNKNTVIDTVLSPSEEISYEWFQEQKRITEFLSGLIDYKPYISRIAVIGLNGKVFFAGGPWIDRTFLETKTMDYMLQNGERHAYFKQGGPTDAISVGRVLRYNRETIGVVMVDLNYDFIRNTYGVKPTADSILYVLDEQNGSSTARTRRRYPYLRKWKRRFTPVRLRRARPSWRRNKTSTANPISSSPAAPTLRAGPRGR